jgi:hypothetical protein
MKGFLWYRNQIKNLLQFFLEFPKKNNVCEFTLLRKNYLVCWLNLVKLKRLSTKLSQT